MKGVIFDMDGVLTDSEAVWQKYWNKAAEERGLSLPEEFKYEICGSSGQAMINTIKKYYHTDDGEAVLYEVAGNYMEELNRHVPEKPYIHEVLPWLKQQGYKIAVASSSSLEIIHRNLKYVDIEKYFDHIVSGQQVAHGKPAPDIFLLAAEKLELPPEECYVLEDAFNGIKAAHAAGCKPVMVIDLVRPTEQIRELCYLVCESLDEFKNRIS